MKSSGIGGQAVIEGVMMKNQDKYAIAVRKPDHEIEMKTDTYTSFSDKVKLFKFPIFRGVLAFIESLTLGMKTLTYSASFYEEEETEIGAKTPEEKAKQQKKDNVMMGATVAFSIILAVGIFIILPFFLSGLFGKLIPSQVVLRIVEGLIRIGLFMGYVLLISQMKDIKRVFMYHGAEHKTINCIETGKDLTVANVRKSSKEHKRCGTSFMLIVMLVSTVFFVFINTETLWLRILLRILLIPVIAGISYEFIRLAGRSESKVVAVLSRPGLWMQGLTTKEPDDEMIEVAIASVEAVFDWKQYLAENGVKKYAKPTEEKTERSTGKGKKNAGKNTGKNRAERRAAANRMNRVKSTATHSMNPAEREPDPDEVVLEELLEQIETTEHVAETGEHPEGTTVVERIANVKQEETTVKNRAADFEKKSKRVLEQEEAARMEAEAKERREQKKAKVRQNTLSALDEDDEEEDDILRALDRYFDEKNEDADE